MADIENVISVLSKAPLFQGLKKRQLERLARRFVEREYAADAAIVTQGQGGEGFFIVVSGKADAIRERLDGTKVVVNTFGPSDYFGELALLDDGPRTASVIAVEPTQCLVLTRWDFFGALKEDVDTAISILKELARRFRLALDAL